jgi:hypothetical protein
MLACPLQCAGAALCSVKIRLTDKATVGVPLNLLEVTLVGASGNPLPRDSLTFTLSSTFNPSLAASNCNDGVTAGLGICHTSIYDTAPSLTVNYLCASATALSQVVVYNRENSCSGCADRIKSFTLDFINAAGLISA